MNSPYYPIEEMSLKETLKTQAGAVSRLPFIRNIVHAHAVYDTLHQLPGFRFLYAGVGYETLHPFDQEYGTETSGSAPPPDQTGKVDYAAMTRFPYWGSQPSYVRTAMTHLPPPETFTFLDLGCGKGRPSLVASEFPFRAILGVELSPGLVEIARKNAAIIAKQFPARTPVQIEEGDACAYHFPAGNIILFLYNPFNEEIMSKVVAGLEAALNEERRDIYFVYFYPTCAACLDNSPAFQRYFEGTVDYAPEERGYGPAGDGAFIIWKSVT